MNAIPFLKNYLKPNHSKNESLEIISHIPQEELNGIEFLLGQNNKRALHSVSNQIIKRAKSKFIPHDICPKRNHAISRPILFVAFIIHRKLGIHPVVGKYGVASIVLFSGAYLATNPIHGIPHFIHDGIAYTIHGIGAAPFAEAVLRFFEKRNKSE